MSRVIPLNSMLNPTSKPSAHAELDGQFPQIMMARTKVTMPSTKSHPEPAKGRKRAASRV